MRSCGTGVQASEWDELGGDCRAHIKGGEADSITDTRIRSRVGRSTAGGIGGRVPLVESIDPSSLQYPPVSADPVLT